MQQNVSADTRAPNKPVQANCCPIIQGAAAGFRLHMTVLKNVFRLLLGSFRFRV